MNTQQPPAPGQLPTTASIVHLAWENFGRFAPAITTTTVLALARYWNENGARHSVGDAALMIALAAGSGITGGISALGQNGSTTASVVGFAGAGVCSVVAATAYSATWPLPLILWVIVTAGIYALANDHWRKAKEARLAAQRTYALRSMERQADYDIADRKATSREQTAKIKAESTEYAYQIIDALQARQRVNPDTAASAEDVLRNSGTATDRAFWHVVSGQ
ncbi:hypothetical protein [Streptacidiphilus sp. EB129]|uniref:hypothetical protein n=1 Tax=Streptacidiphilus sp. EB129 TaxID=3156262 RepID=UPI00351772CC